MSLTADGVWKAGVWASTVWADGVWSEGAAVQQEQNSGGWEVWIRHRRRLAKRLEEERLEEIEQQRKLLEQAQQAIAEAEAKEKAERVQKERDSIRKSDQKIISLRKTISAEKRLAEEIQERIYRLVMLNALEIDTLERQIEQERKRRRNAIALLLLAA
jgi:hypothetical protein